MPGVPGGRAAALTSPGSLFQGRSYKRSKWEFGGREATFLRKGRAEEKAWNTEAEEPATAWKSRPRRE